MKGVPIKGGFAGSFTDLFDPCCTVGDFLKALSEADGTRHSALVYGDCKTPLKHTVIKQDSTRSIWFDFIR